MTVFASFGYVVAAPFHTDADVLGPAETSKASSISSTS